MLTHFSLFSGIGGLDLAAEWAGFRTVGQCEWVNYPTKVLEKHWPDVPRWRDIRSVKAEDFYKRTGLRTVTVISGGFPCQPFSVAGKRKGKDDDRYLWPEMLRVIQELRPNWVVGENVAGIRNLALDDVLFNLESAGYEAVTFNIPACAVNAPHRRARIFIVANSNSEGRSRILHGNLCTCLKTFERWPDVTLDSCADITAWMEKSLGKPGICRDDDGIPHRVDRLKCLGNAVVPQQAYPIFKAIADIENLEVTS